MPSIAGSFSKDESDGLGKRLGARLWLYPLWLLGVLMLCALGVWQLGKSEQKRQWVSEQSRVVMENPGDAEIEQALKAANWIPVRLQVDWLEREPLFLDNRTHAGRAGYEVLLPVALPESRVLLVNLGWVEAPPTRERKPALGRVESSWLEGVIGRPIKTFTLNDEQARGWRLQRLDLEQAGRYWGLQLEPWVLWLSRPVQADIVPRLPGSGAMSPERHLGYAVQWFALALALVMIAGVLEWKVRRRRHRAD